MKKFTASVIAVVILAGLLGSCVSLQDRTITAQERAEMGVVGTTTTQFTSFRFLHFIGNTGVKNKAYTQLLANARKEHGNDVDVRNVQISGGFSGTELLMLGAAAAGIGMEVALDGDGGGFLAGAGVFLNVLGHFEKITATGDVVQVGAAGASVRPANNSNTNYDKLEDALDKAAGTLINEIPANATIAILNVSSDDQGMARYVLDELEYKLVQSRKFQIVDRRQLEQIRAEQNFQISGEVDDTSAVSIGNMLGASIVITGDISSVGQTMRLSLRTMDVRTARILTIAREQF